MKSEKHAVSYPLLKLPAPDLSPGILGRGSRKRLVTFSASADVTSIDEVVSNGHLGKSNFALDTDTLKCTCSEVIDMKNAESNTQSIKESPDYAEIPPVSQRLHNQPDSCVPWQAMLKSMSAHLDTVGLSQAEVDPEEDNYACTGPTLDKLPSHYEEIQKPTLADTAGFVSSSNRTQSPVCHIPDDGKGRASVGERTQYPIYYIVEEDNTELIISTVENRDSNIYQQIEQGQPEDDSLNQSDNANHSHPPLYQTVEHDQYQPLNANPRQSQIYEHLI